MALHQGHAGLQRITWSDGQRILGHDLADRSTGGILATDHHTAHQIALGEDAGQLAVLKNWYGADVVLHHHAGDFKHGLVGFGGYYDLIPEQITDQHLHLPRMHLPQTSAGKRRARRTVSIRLYRRKQSHSISGPAAEYMSKIARKEEKNELRGRGALPRNDGAKPRHHTVSRFDPRPKKSRKIWPPKQQAPGRRCGR